MFPADRYPTLVTTYFGRVEGDATVECIAARKTYTQSIHRIDKTQGRKFERESNEKVMGKTFSKLICVVLTTHCPKSDHYS